MLNTPVTQLFECKHYALENGLQVILSSQHHAPVITSIMMYPVGLRQEQPGQYGMSHFVEHMMFKGTERFGKGEIDKLSLQCGGSNNAYTSLDSTVYNMSVPASHCETVLELEADRMQNTLFSNTEVNAEREVVLEEWRAAEDDPDDAFWQELSRKAMGIHPYGRPVLGYEKDILNFTRENLKTFFDAHYQPQLATLVLVGDLPADVEELIQKHFGHIPKGSTPRPTNTLLIRKPKETSEPLIKYNPSVNTPRGVMCWPAPSFHHSDYATFLVLQYILTEGWSSQLHHLWVEKNKWVTQVSSFIFESQEPYLFWVEVDTETFTPLIQSQLENSFYNLSISEKDVSKAKIQLLTDLFLQQETTEQRADFIAECLSAGNIKAFNNYFKRIQAVSHRDIQALFKTYLCTQKQVTGWLLPEITKNP